MISIVCVYNNENLYKQMCSSAREYTQSEDIEFIGVDNTQDRFRSAAEAYNYAIDIIPDRNEGTLIFCHQDIIWGDGDIDLFAKLCDDNSGAIFGAAGAIADEHRCTNKIISAIREGAEFSYESLQIGQTREVLTLDECVVAMNGAVLKKIVFDSNCCNGWHFYAVDLSLQCQQEGIKVMAVGLNLQHLSNGSKDKEYRLAERRLAQKWHRYYNKVFYTTGWTYTGYIKYHMLKTYRIIKGTY